MEARVWDLDPSNNALWLGQEERRMKSRERQGNEAKMMQVVAYDCTSFFPASSVFLWYGMHPANK